MSDNLDKYIDDQGEREAQWVEARMRLRGVSLLLKQARDEAAIAWATVYMGDRIEHETRYILDQVRDLRKRSTRLSEPRLQALRTDLGRLAEHIDKLVAEYRPEDDPDTSGVPPLTGEN